jgi:outer membrane biosynthesis protein TonB
MRGERSYSDTVEERSPLLQHYAAYMNQQSPNGNAIDHHNQFCNLMGVTPHTLPPGQSHVPHPQSLYARALQRRRNQSYIYALTATLTNGLLLSQVVLGAALTGLGASDSSRVLITVFGALNTIIAGVIAFLKSRGQPLRARMFRDDLDRVVDEIESSAVMWLGISSGVHGYDAIDTDELVTVRSEVARLTRLYVRAVKANTTNDPDLYAAGGPGDFHHAALRQRPEQSAPVVAPQPIDPLVQAPVIQTPVAVEPDDSPATQPPVTQPPAPVAAPKPVENTQPVVDEPKTTTPENSEPQPASTTNSTSRPTDGNGTTTPVPTPTPAANPTPNNETPVNTSAPATPAIEKLDPDASPATAARLPSHESHSEKAVDKLSKLVIKSEHPFARGMSFQ